MKTFRQSRSADRQTGQDLTLGLQAEQIRWPLRQLNTGPVLVTSKQTGHSRSSRRLAVVGSGRLETSSSGEVSESVLGRFDGVSETEAAAEMGEGGLSADDTSSGSDNCLFKEPGTPSPWLPWPLEPLEPTCPDFKDEAITAKSAFKITRTN